MVRFILKKKLVNKTTFLEPSFQIIFPIPKLPPMWPPLLLNFPIAFILSYIYLLLLYSLVVYDASFFSILQTLNFVFVFFLLNSSFFRG